MSDFNGFGVVSVHTAVLDGVVPMGTDLDKLIPSGTTSNKLLNDIYNPFWGKYFSFEVSVTYQDLCFVISNCYGNKCRRDNVVDTCTLDHYCESCNGRVEDITGNDCLDILRRTYSTWNEIFDNAHKKSYTIEIEVTSVRDPTDAELLKLDEKFKADRLAIEQKLEKLKQQVAETQAMLDGPASDLIGMQPEVYAKFVADLERIRS